MSYVNGRWVEKHFRNWDDMDYNARFKKQPSHTEYCNRKTLKGSKSYNPYAHGDCPRLLRNPYLKGMQGFWMIESEMISARLGTRDLQMTVRLELNQPIAQAVANFKFGRLEGVMNFIHPDVRVEDFRTDESSAELDEDIDSGFYMDESTKQVKELKE